MSNWVTGRLSERRRVGRGTIRVDLLGTRCNLLCTVAALLPLVRSSSHLRTPHQASEVKAHKNLKISIFFCTEGILSYWARRVRGDVISSACEGSWFATLVKTDVVPTHPLAGSPQGRLDEGRAAASWNWWILTISVIQMSSRLITQLRLMCFIYMCHSGGSQHLNRESESPVKPLCVRIYIWCDGRQT